MKKTFLLLTLLSLLLSCDKQELTQTSEKQVTFSVSNFENTTRALTADGKEMTDLWVFDYMNGQQVQAIHQTSSDADFGTPTVTLSYGTHTLYFVCSRGRNFELSGSTITWSVPNDTFGASLSIDVNDGTATGRSVTLPRLSTRLRLVIKDMVPDDLATVSIAPAEWWHGWNYAAQLATSSTDEEVVVSVPDSYHGTAGQLSVVYTCLSPLEWSTDVQVIARDADDNIIGKAVISSVPFKRNRVTEYSGNLFNSSGTFSISLNDTWEEPYTNEW